MRGRRPTGPNYVDRLPDCDDQTKRRLKVIMQTMCGELRVNEACAILGIGPQRFHQMRDEAMRGAAAVLKPRPKGRPPRRRAPQQDQVEQLQQELGDARIELRAAQARAEIATLLPRVLEAPQAPATAPADGKKTRRRR